MLVNLNQTIHIFSNTVGLLSILSVLILYKANKSRVLMYYALFLLSFTLMFSLDYFYTIYGIDYNPSNLTFHNIFFEFLYETISNTLLITTTLFSLSLIKIKYKKQIKLFFYIIFISNILLLIISLFNPTTFISTVNIFSTFSFVFCWVFNIILLFRNYSNIESLYIKKFLILVFILSIVFLPFILLFDIIQIDFFNISLLNNIDFDLIFFSIWNILSICIFIKYFNYIKKVSVIINPSTDVLTSIGLTNREKEVLNELILGKTYSDIADKLTIAPVTVKTHVLRIYKKIGVKNKVALLDKLKNI